MIDWGISAKMRYFYLFWLRFFENTVRGAIFVQ